MSALHGPGKGPGARPARGAAAPSAEPRRPWPAELPPGSDRPPAGVSRRRFLELMAASAALAGAAGCADPPEEIVPYARRPPEVVPGLPLGYATSFVLDGHAIGLVVESREGRPIKVEGNPEHPASLGASGVFEQASLLGLYDPRRGRGVRRGNRPATLREVTAGLAAPRADRGEGLRFLLEPTSSPLRARLIAAVLERHPRARFTFWSPLADPAPLAAAEAMFGRPLVPRLDLERADVVVSLGADPAGAGPFRLRHARALARRRDPEAPDGMSRLWIAEEMPSETGALADQPLAIRRGLLPALLEALAAELGTAAGGGGRPERETSALPAGALSWARAAARDLERARGRCVVLAGEGLPASAHARAAVLTERLGGAGAGDVLAWSEPALLDAGSRAHELGPLIAELEAGAVDTLVILEGNPVYAAPAGIDLERLIAAVPESLYLGLHEDETAEAAGTYAAAAHSLESWGDARAWDGTASLIQPLIRPLFAGHTADEVLARIAGLDAPGAPGGRGPGSDVDSGAAVPGRPSGSGGATGRAGESGSGEAGSEGGSGRVPPARVGPGRESGVAGVHGTPGERVDRRLLRELWVERLGGGEAGERRWLEALQLGLVPGTDDPVLTPPIDPDALARLAAAERPGGLAAVIRGPDLPSAAGAGTGEAAAPRNPAPAPPDSGSEHGSERVSGVEPLELSFRADPRLHDGRFAGNAWLHELPDPVTKLTWGNAALMSPGTAERLGVAEGDLVELALPGSPATVRAPVLPVEGHAGGAVTVRLGHGRRRGAGVGDGVGFDAYRLRPREHPWIVQGLRVVRLFEAAPEGEARSHEHGPPLSRRLAIAQRHQRLHGREIALHTTLGELRRHPERFARHRGPVESLYRPPPQSAPAQWAMTIDLARCTGCGACAAACQAENNVPVVGPEGVVLGREMHWLRIDRYRTGGPGSPEAVHQPMLCQHCEMAPCEYVCPVNATVHSSDGLNQMIYNRCIGTRFCSNNCPYKVRRFNWFDYNQPRSELECLVLNPEVTVRERGVMEKCTYCVQRIRRAGIEARVEGRDPGGDGVVTACQQACPTEAIVFGSLTDPDSRVARSRESPRMYEELHELGTRPRTRYLAKVTNPAPHRGEPGAEEGGERG